MITVAGLAGILGAKLYHLLEDPGVLFCRSVGAIVEPLWVCVVWRISGRFWALLLLGWRAKLPLLQFLDACSPAAAFGYGIGRIGCFLSGDGDYGKPTNLPWGMSFPNGVVPTTDSCVQWGWPANCKVHPAPLYELVIWCAIGAFLWHLGTRTLKSSNAKTTAGTIFCSYLILTGIGRFLVEIIRINPRSFLGMTNAQVASVASVIAGSLLLWWIKSRIQTPTQAAHQDSIPYLPLSSRTAYSSIWRRTYCRMPP